MNCKETQRQFDFTPFVLLCEKHSITFPGDDFCSWFIGFTEGDGSFTKSKRGTDFYFVVSQASLDGQILEYIKSKLPFGTLYKQSKRVSRYMVQDKESLLLIIALFNGNLLLPSRKIQFQRWLGAYNVYFKKEIQSVERQILPSLQNAWISGFTDAEGCFTASFLSNSKGFRLRYILSQKGYKNLPLLSHFILLFRGGALEKHSAADNYSYILSGVKKSFNVFQYFLGFPLKTKKRESFLLWQSIQKDVGKKLHLQEGGRKQLMERAKKVNSIRRKSK